ncbi:hypothetical protein ASF48_09280 [Rathayibacter sp. Leaf299]|uniref:hypothetical protein n=1 Tax=unclassified Rathayibacter TaxID=2609250 RepID=UPI0006FA9DDF|nr:MULTISPECIES: hypothetical protein [unclassified Rathayibacter]KQQ20772.1 hypothetical protein ASF48_09280 [Rathayibacter sp. Leaf299]
MPEWILLVSSWLQDSTLGAAVRGTPFLYPTLESVHILGIAALIGPAFAFDLRLLGIGHRIAAVTTAARVLLPISHVGLVVALATGAVLLTAQAPVVVSSGAAPWKLGLLLVAAANILVFHRGVYRNVEKWADAAATPLAARLAAIVSLTAWTGVVFAGRFLAYT